MKSPDGWTTGSLGTVVRSIRAGYSAPSESRPAGVDEQGVLRTSSVARGVFDPIEHKVVLTGNEKLRVPVTANTIILGRKNSDEVVGASAFVANDYPKLYLSDLLWEIRTNDAADPLWLSYVLQLGSIRERLRLSATGTQSSMKNLNRAVFLKIAISVPPLPEQRKIAGILRIWDDAIDKTVELRRLADGRRVELAERMLVPSHGVRRRLSELTRSIKTRNSEGFLGRESVMGVSNRSGLVPMREQTIAADISRYQVLPPRAFAYNPMRINVGSIAMSRLESHVLVSPDYVLFQCDERELRPEYLDHVLRTRWWLHHVNAGASGSVRTRTYYDDLAAISIAAPPIAEQDNVSRALDGLEKEIQLLQRKAELLRTQKRGLMQKLLTGQVRVNVAADIEPGGQNDD